jgi:hypothetical protein
MIEVLTLLNVIEYETMKSIRILSLLNPYNTVVVRPQEDDISERHIERKYFIIMETYQESLRRADVKEFFNRLIEYNCLTCK